MNPNLIIAGLSLGAISSFHCVGMCGPIAFALPVQQLSKWRASLAMFSYHLGRIITYSALGAVFGTLGRQVYLAGFQRWFSIVLGIALLLMMWQYIGTRSKIQFGLLNRLQLKVQNWIGMLLKDQRPQAFLLLGIANGLLPCGMVYLAIAGAVSTSHLTDAIAFMTAFGLGTFPAMMALSLFGIVASISVRNRIRQLTPLVIGIMGLLLILRGLNLGIPFISPVLESAREAAVSCH